MHITPEDIINKSSLDVDLRNKVLSRLGDLIDNVKSSRYWREEHLAIIKGAILHKCSEIATMYPECMALWVPNIPLENEHTIIGMLTTAGDTQYVVYENITKYKIDTPSLYTEEQLLTLYGVDVSDGVLVLAICSGWAATSFDVDQLKEMKDYINEELKKTTI
jgi:hypothetical protein